MVGEAVRRVGSEGVISVEEAKGTEAQLDVVEGMQFDRGYLSAYFVTDPERMECVVEDALVLLYDGKIGLMKDLIGLLEEIATTGRALLVVAENIEGEALATLVVNRARGALRSVAVKAPGFVERRKAMLEDIAVLTGGEVLSSELGAKLENTKPRPSSSNRKMRAATSGPGSRSNGVPWRRPCDSSPKTLTWMEVWWSSRPEKETGSDWTLRSERSLTCETHSPQPPRSSRPSRHRPASDRGLTDTPCRSSGRCVEKPPGRKHCGARAVALATIGTR